MITPGLEDLTNALNFLVDQPNYLELKDDIAALCVTHYGAFTGLLTPLKPLVDYARSKGGPEWLLPLRQVADPAAGYAPSDLVDLAEASAAPKAKRNKTRHAEYQRTYMRATRDRERKACKLRWQLYSPEAKATMPKGLIGDDRKAFLENVRALWQRRKAEALEGAVYAAERNELGSQFWKTVDEQLDAGLAGDLSTARYVLGLTD